MTDSDDTRLYSCGLFDMHFNSVDGMQTQPAVIVRQVVGLTLDNVGVGMFQRCLRLEGGQQGNLSNFNLSAFGNTAPAIENVALLEIAHYTSVQSGTHYPAWTTNFCNFIIGGASIAKKKKGILMNSGDGLSFVNGYIANITQSHLTVNTTADPAPILARFVRKSAR